jgi:PAS domain S-box-containing protein
VRQFSATEKETAGAPLCESNSDSTNVELICVLNTLDLPVIIVDYGGKIVRFNQAATETLELTSADVGQPLSSVRLLGDLQDIEKLMAQVISDGTPSQREIQAGDRWFILRIAPCPSADHNVAGAVLTFTNVTAFRASIAQAIYDREYTKTILNTVAQPLVVLDADLRVQTGNRAFYTMFGVSRDKTKDMPLRHLGNHEWNAHSLWDSVKATLLGKKEFKTLEVEGEFPVIGPRTFLFDACRLGGERAALILVCLTDITERKLSEQKLLRSQGDLQDFVENASVGMHWVGPDGIIVWANRTELDMLGYSAEEYVGHHIMEFHADRSVIDDILRRLANRETLHEYEAKLLCKDGSIREVVTNSNVLWEGDKFIHTRCFTRDVTERKRTEAALFESEQRYRTLFNSMDEGFCIIEMLFDESQKPIDYRFLEINPSFENQSGLKDAKGKRVRELAPNLEQHWFDVYGKIALTGEPARFENPAGELNRWYEVYAFRIEPPEAHRVGVVFNNITDRKRQEEELEKIVAERTAALRETVGELEAFSYSIAHDMRAPLRGMKGFAEILEEEHSSQLDAQAREYLRRISTSARRMDGLIQDVLNYSKIVKAQIVIEPQDLDRLTRDILETYPQWQPPKAEIRIEGVLPEVLANQAFLTQCISNLLSNAVKFVAPGVVPRVRIWAEEVTPTPTNSQTSLDSESNSSTSLHPSGPLVRLYFEDNGIGIAPDKHARIFRMFERIHPLAEYEGTGIGLTIACRAAERMGGSIGFESELGRGSRFWIQLRKS